MTNQLCALVFGCMFSGMLYASAAKAADGRISFSGRIVVPTCQVVLRALDLLRPSLRSTQSCGEQDSHSESFRAYTETARQLDHIEPDRVLNYFDGYLAAQQAGVVPMLVTRTYD